MAGIFTAVVLVGVANLNGWFFGRSSQTPPRQPTPIVTVLKTDADEIVAEEPLGASDPLFEPTDLQADLSSVLPEEEVLTDGDFILMKRTNHQTRISR